MCGRYTLRTSLKRLFKQLELFDVPEPAPRYNIAPGQEVAVVRAQDNVGRELAELRWGLIPPWSKDPGKGPAPINARAETAAEKPMFREPLGNRRCLVLGDGYYEWKRLAGRNQPFYFQRRDGGPFTFAGLWQRWEGEENRAIDSCTVLTTTANDLSRPIHDRMPVILEPEHYAAWLAPAVHRPAELLPLLRPYPAERMRVHPVSEQVNNFRNDNPRLIVPVELPDAESGPVQGVLF